MALVQSLRVRFEEVDFARIVYFPRLFGYCHSVFEDFFEKEVGVTYADMLIKRRVGFPVVRTEGDFKSPLRFGDVCRVLMETNTLGPRSVTCGSRFYLPEPHRASAQVKNVSVRAAVRNF